MMRATTAGPGRLARAAVAAVASAASGRAARPQQAAAVAVAVSRRCLSAPPQKPPPPPSPEELQKMVATSEAQVSKIREGTYTSTVQPPAVADVPDLPTYLPRNQSEIAVLSEQPANQKARKVTIRQKAQTAMQSAPSKSYAWTITWPTAERWSNPLMGWTSTADPLSNAVMYFDTPEEAARFAQRQGWSFEIEAPIKRDRELGTNKYAFNFLAEDVEKRVRKEGTRTKEFVRPGAGASNWFMPLRYHGDGECDQHGPKAGNKK